MPPRNCMSLTCTGRPVRRAGESLHHPRPARTALALALALAPAWASACPQCASSGAEPTAFPAALALLALGPLLAMAAGFVWVARESHRGAELE